MIARALLLALAISIPAQAGGTVDWQRRVLSGSGVGAPDLAAPSIAVARKGAEKAARNLAVQGALDALRAAGLTSGGTGAQLFAAHPELAAAVEARLRATSPVRERYFVDGGVSLDLELPLEALPPALLEALRPLATGTAVPDPLDPDHLSTDVPAIAQALRELTPQEAGAVLSSQVTAQQGVIILTLHLARPGKPEKTLLLKGKSPAALRLSLEKALQQLFQ